MSEEFFKDRRKKKKFIIIIASVVTVIVVLFGACAIYLADYYHADESAIEAFLPQGYVVNENPDGTIVFGPENAGKGFIFYPGGKVEHTSYIPLMQALSEQGVLCILVEMPFNLAVFDIDAAEGIQEKYPQIENWYIGGHSLGGSMAASYLVDHKEEYDGLVLLGAYSTADLSDSDIDVLSIYGSEDKVMDRESYDEYESNLPAGFEELVIEGGCHAYFGMYGKQSGDGIPEISNEEQINITAEAVFDFIFGKNDKT